MLVENKPINGKAMTDEEKILLLEIDSLYKKLLQEPDPKWDGRSTKLKPDGTRYSINAKELERKVIKLHKEYNPAYLHDQVVRMFQQTCHKEVPNVQRCYDDAIKNGASRKRYTEFTQSMDEANYQIQIDLSSLLNEIKNLTN